ncbi:polymer-forming cytoskeletal domain-containing protein [Purpureocillium lavendulum]|uniref:Polymer-forming cytoskeletal domain-containing protein n=1 Tax=Purpureocillium lavendulum TaxID=1247861 RepID=A0AB34G548_9HYPO|nr:polymer-forming cytoskeletal domain-containing protein [Purpureocillium lavendulum]
MRAFILSGLLALAAAAPSLSSEKFRAVVQRHVRALPDGGETVTLEETVQRVQARHLAIDADNNIDFAHVHEARAEPASSTIDKRTDFSRAKITCDNKEGYYPAPLDLYKSQLAHISKLADQPSMFPGPNTCSRVSCDRKWASKQDKTLLGWSSVADGLKAIYAKCGPSEKQNEANAGIARHPTDWEVRWERVTGDQEKSC